MLLSITPVTICGSRPAGSLEFPTIRIFFSVYLSIGDSLSHDDKKGINKTGDRMKARRMAR